MDKYAKAITAALIATLGVIGTALADGVITGQEWALAGVAFLTALGVVWGVPNKQPTGTYARSVTFGGPEGTGPGDGG